MDPDGAYPAHAAWGFRPPKPEGSPRQGNTTARPPRLPCLKAPSSMGRISTVGVRSTPRRGRSAQDDEFVEPVKGLLSAVPSGLQSLP